MVCIAPVIIAPCGTRDIGGEFGNLIRASFVEHCYQEALALIEENKSVVLALAQALIDHPDAPLTPPRSTR